MKLVISFSAREKGNCDQIANHITSSNDKIIYLRNMNIHPCMNCNYECFEEKCVYREDDIYRIYNEMCNYDKVIFLVPMYGGNPSSLYFIFHERCQDYFMHNDNYDEIIMLGTLAGASNGGSSHAASRVFIKKALYYWNLW